METELVSLKKLNFLGKFALQLTWSGIRTAQRINETPNEGHAFHLHKTENLKNGCIVDFINKSKIRDFSLKILKQNVPDKMQH